MSGSVVQMPARRVGKSLARRIVEMEGLVRAPALPVRRPAIPVFAIGRANRCPDCHSEAFTVGRVTAECGGCGLPLAIVELRRLS
jgi:hypothetical protein